MIAALPVRERKEPNWDERSGAEFSWNPFARGRCYMEELQVAKRPGTLATVIAILKARGAKVTA